MPFFVILITMILIANMKYFTLKIGYFYFFKYVKGFFFFTRLIVRATSILQEFYLKPMHAVFHLSLHRFLMFQVPLNRLTPQQICGTDYLFLAFFCLQLFSSTSAPPFLSHSWKTSMQ